MNYPNLERLIEIIEILRSENGCKWDREQTHTTLRRNMLEEAYEAVDAIDDNDMKHLQEELGDVLLQVVLHSQIAKENKSFDIRQKVISKNKKVNEDIIIISDQTIFELQKSYCIKNLL